LSSLPDEGRLRAFARFQIIRPFLEEGVPLTQIAQDQGLVLRTARRWVVPLLAGQASQAFPAVAIDPAACGWIAPARRQETVGQQQACHRKNTV